MLKRYLTEAVSRDLNKKMVFISGPRQVGKTTLAKNFLIKDKGYLNWDIPEHREMILRHRLPIASLWVFDELHKYRSWRNYLKGVFDGRKKNQRILVTGSARLEYYRFGGDSLQGRYYFWRLHPLSVTELSITSQKDFQDLIKLGGFPEPFFSGGEIEAKRWSLEYRTRLIEEDLLSLENVQDVGKLEMLMLRLPELVGSPLSLNALREDLQTSHKTVARWITVLERLYAFFLISPFGSPRIRAVKKERKHYHFDWTLIEDPGKRFENLVACHLLKWIHYEQDGHGRSLELRYFRDIDRREVDFVVLENGKPFLMIECKQQETAVSPGLVYLHRKFPTVQAWQVTAVGKEDFQTPEGIRVCPAVKFLTTLV